jgi:hypothetical protein
MNCQDWLIPMYAAKAPAVVGQADRSTVEQKSPTVEQEGLAIVADRPVAEQKSLTVVEDNLVAEEESPATTEVVELQSLATLEEGLAAETEGPQYMWN